MALAQKTLADLPPGRHHDSGARGVPGLTFVVGDSGSRSFVARLYVAGRRVEIGLGGLRDTPLSLARERCLELRRQVRAGVDPRVARAKRAAAATPFAILVDEVCTDRESRPGNANAIGQWRSSLTTYALPTLGKVPVAEIDASMIAAALKPTWNAKAETARRTLQRIGAVIEFARAKNLYSAVSPLAAARTILGPQRDEVEHFAALPLDDVPRFVRELRRLRSPSSLALQFTILTASRTRPVRFLEASHVTGDVWSAPGELMKHGKPHKTPLSSGALAALAEAQRFHGPVTFSNGSAPLSEMALLMCARGIEPNISVHGFRSSFTDWCRHNKIDHDVQETSLAHIPPGEVRRAYARSDILELRRPVLQSWSDFINGHR